MYRFRRSFRKQHLHKKANKEGWVSRGVLHNHLGKGNYPCFRIQVFTILFVTLPEILVGISTQRPLGPGQKHHIYILKSEQTIGLAKCVQTTSRLENHCG